MSEAKTTIDLQPFCAKERSRYSIEIPFVQGGFRYATNSRIIVRVPADGEPDTVVDDFKFPDAGILPWRPAGELRPWPAAAYIRKVMDCHECDGAGVINQQKCSHCGGNGECPDCGGEGRCVECNGSGYSGGQICSACDGAKETEQDFATPIDSRHVRASNDKLIRALPNVCWVATGTPSPTSPIYFTFDGGEGMVSPVRVDE